MGGRDLAVPIRSDTFISLESMTQLTHLCASELRLYAFKGINTAVKVFV